MIRLLVIADDFTGALDTGVQFAKAGVSVLVRIEPSFNLAEIPEDVQVLVVNTESRHMGAGEAYDVVYDVVDQAVQEGILHIYKKTDSGLRGNIGAELSAALEASGRKELDFIPAFPQMNRLTIGGVAYIDGLPVEESVFGKDPFNPVKRSAVADIIGLQTDMPVYPGLCMEEPEEQSIRVYDISSEGELLTAGQEILKKNALRLTAGCAGFASVLPGLLNLETSVLEDRVPFAGGLLVANGSVNPISIAQLDHAEADGFVRCRLTVKEKLDEGFWEEERGREALNNYLDQIQGKDRIIFDTNDLPFSGDTSGYVAELGISRETMRKRISSSMGKLLKELMESGQNKTMLVMGGDTLQSFLSQVGVKQMRPIRELLPGTVLSIFEWGGNSYHLVSKSGGFGAPELIIELEKMVRA